MLNRLKYLVLWCVCVCVRTGVSYRRVQQVHGGSAQAQSVHPVRGLFEIRHHARSAEGRPESARAEGALVPGVQALWSPVFRRSGPRCSGALVPGVQALWSAPAAGRRTMSLRVKMQD